MILDVAPHTAQLVSEYAQKQGISVDELLLQMIDDEVQGFDFIEKDGIYATGNITLSPAEFQAIMDDLDAPPRPNPKLQALIKKYGGLGV